MTDQNKLEPELVKLKEILDNKTPEELEELSAQMPEAIAALTSKTKPTPEQIDQLSSAIQAAIAGKAKAAATTERSDKEQFTKLQEEVFKHRSEQNPATIAPAVAHETTAPATEPELEAAEPQAILETTEPELEAAEPQATLETTEPELEAAEPQATPETTEPELEGAEPEAALETTEPELEGVEPEATPETTEPELAGVEPELEGVEPEATPETTEPELEGAEPEATPETTGSEFEAAEANPVTTGPEVQEARPAAIFTASGDIANAIHEELAKQQAIIQSKVDSEIEKLELTSAYQQYLADEDKQNTPTERTNFLFEYVPTQPGTTKKNKKNISALADELHDFSREIYSSIHNDPKFKNSLHTIQWGANNQESQSFSIGSQTIESVNGKADKMPFRNIDIPTTISPDEAPLYLAFAAHDSTNQNMKNPAFYFSVNYNDDGKLDEMVCPTPVKFSKDEPHIAYVEDKGKRYTLPITKQQFDALEQSLNQNQSRGQDQIIQRGTSAPDIKANKSYKTPTAEESQEAKKNLKKPKTTDRNQSNKAHPATKPKSPTKDNALFTTQRQKKESQDLSADEQSPIWQETYQRLAKEGKDSIWKNEIEMFNAVKAERAKTTTSAQPDQLKNTISTTKKPSSPKSKNNHKDKAAPPPSNKPKIGWKEILRRANPENLDYVKPSQVKKAEEELLGSFMDDPKAPKKIAHQALHKTTKRNLTKSKNVVKNKSIKKSSGKTL